MGEPARNAPGRPDPQLRPSEYTGALIRALMLREPQVAGAAALEVGCGSGVVLAALAALNARSLTGVDIEADAIAASRALLTGAGLDGIADLHVGDMWAPFPDRRFDLVVANLPQFPMAAGAAPGRRPTWSAGGVDGRKLLDQFVAGLVDHLTPGGRSILTHNAFVEPERTADLAAADGLAMETVLSELVYVPDDKLSHMTAGVRTREFGRTLHQLGPYVFGEVRIVEIAAPETLSPESLA